MLFLAVIYGNLMLRVVFGVELELLYCKEILYGGKVMSD